MSDENRRSTLNIERTLVERARGGFARTSALVLRDGGLVQTLYAAPAGTPPDPMTEAQQDLACSQVLAAIVRAVMRRPGGEGLTPQKVVVVVREGFLSFGLLESDAMLDLKAVFPGGSWVDGSGPRSWYQTCLRVLEVEP